MNDLYLIWLSASLGTAFMGYVKLVMPALGGIKDTYGLGKRTIVGGILFILMIVFAPLVLPLVLSERLGDRFVEGFTSGINEDED